MPSHAWGPPRSEEPPCPPILSSVASLPVPLSPDELGVWRREGGPLGVGAVTSSFGTSYLGCQAQTWTKRWAVACFPCRNPGCQGFCNVYTRNQFGKVIHTEQESQKAPWKSSRVTPSSARHRHRLAGCTTVKPGLAVSGSVSPPWSTCFLEVQAGRGLVHTTLLCWV